MCPIGSRLPQRLHRFSTFRHPERAEHEEGEEGNKKHRDQEEMYQVPPPSLASVSSFDPRNGGSTHFPPVRLSNTLILRGRRVCLALLRLRPLLHLVHQGFPFSLPFPSLPHSALSPPLFFWREGDLSWGMRISVCPRQGAPWARSWLVQQALSILLLPEDLVVGGTERPLVLGIGASVGCHGSRC